VGKPDVKRPFGRHRRRREYNIKIDLQEIKWGVNWLIWLRIVTGDEFL
jgi:hypothetical protein